MATTRIALAEAKAKFSAVVEGVAHRNERYVIERHGKAVAVLVSMDDFRVIEGQRPRPERPRGALALVGLWHDVADADVDAMADAITRGRQRVRVEGRSR